MQCWGYTTASDYIKGGDKGERDPPRHLLSSPSVPPDCRCNVTLSLMPLPQWSTLFLKQWAKIKSSLDSVRQVLCYSKEVECIVVHIWGMPVCELMLLKFLPSLGGQKQYLAPSTKVPTTNWDTIATKVHPGTPMSLLSFLTERWWGVTYRNVGAPRKGHTGESLPGRDDGFPVVP